jgi:large subunit ribosomal protein L7/L12
MAKLAVDDLITAFEEMTLLELKDFRDKFKDHFDVQAAAPMMAMAAGAMP